MQLKKKFFFVCTCSDPANVNASVNAVIASVPIAMRIGYFHATLLAGSVACMPIGLN